jgi:hypothetical protein
LKSRVEAVFFLSSLAFGPILAIPVVTIAGWSMLWRLGLLDFWRMLRDVPDRRWLDNEISATITITAFTPFHPYVLPCPHLATSITFTTDPGTMWTMLFRMMLRLCGNA